MNKMNETKPKPNINVGIKSEIHVTVKGGIEKPIKK